MANNCMTTLSVQSDTPMTEEQHKGIEADLNANVTYSADCHVAHSDDSLMEIELDTRWNVSNVIEPLKAIAQKYLVNIRAVGIENGVGFVQVVCIDKEGTVIQDAEIGYAF